LVGGVDLVKKNKLTGFIIETEANQDCIASLLIAAQIHIDTCTSCKTPRFITLYLFICDFTISYAVEPFY